MKPLKIVHISDIDTDNFQNISYTLDSKQIIIEKNFIIMEKTPDYIFHYLTLLFYEKKLHKKYSLNYTIKSINNDVTEIIIDTDHDEFFKLTQRILETIEQHFSIFIDCFTNYENKETFIQQLNKANLFNKLNANLDRYEEKNKNKI